MQENRQFFRADTDVKVYFRSLNPKERERWSQLIDNNEYEDLWRYNLANEIVFLQSIEQLPPDKDGIKKIFSFLNDKINFIVNSGKIDIHHPLQDLELQQANLGGGGCGLRQNFSAKKGEYALAEFILPRNGRYIRALLQARYSRQEGSCWYNGYFFDKITIDDQDTLIGYLFQCERSECAMSDQPHDRAKNCTPYN